MQRVLIVEPRRQMISEDGAMIPMIDIRVNKILTRMEG
jgi:hypothetical protein